MTERDEVLDALRAIETLAEVLMLDPSLKFDRMCLALLIEREAQRAQHMLNPRTK